ncbi:MAG: acyl carrier protein phosphodiesterase [Flavobacteriaceae bacterium]|jgi:acyl carrier protein phosphodiesterase|nr:acyl carrier protein phosphodiesterase [Flavobacteriaceae bacterium]
MNFLAHIYLSGENELIKIGNFVADSVRGKQYLDYPLDIQKGIKLHREIDSYTDQHLLWRQTKKPLVPRYNHYSAVLVDMYYDHFLAKYWSTYSTVSLEDYAATFYESLERNYEILPSKVQQFLPILLKENWLVLYQDIEGLKYILTKMDGRTKGVSKMSFGTEELLVHYDEFLQNFEAFFEELQLHLKNFVHSNNSLSL